MADVNNTKQSLYNKFYLFNYNGRVIYHLSQNKFFGIPGIPTQPQHYDVKILGYVMNKQILGFVAKRNNESSQKRSFTVIKNNNT